MRGSYELHQKCVQEVLFFLNKYGTFWSHLSGVGKCLVTGNVVRYGLVHSPDVIGFFRGSGKFGGFEIKTGNGRQTHGQINFQMVMEKAGALYFLVHYQPPDYLDALKKRLDETLGIL